VFVSDVRHNKICVSVSKSPTKLDRIVVFSSSSDVRFTRALTTVRNSQVESNKGARLNEHGSIESAVHIARHAPAVELLMHVVVYADGVKLKGPVRRHFVGEALGGHMAIILGLMRGWFSVVVPAVTGIVFRSFLRAHKAIRWICSLA